MGVFDFIKDAGEKLFGKKTAEAAKVGTAEDPAQVLMETVKGLGLEVESLRIDVAEDVATVQGVAPSQEVREKVVLVMGNTRGVARVDDRMTVERPEPEAVMYTVKSGDTLSKIAKQHYGQASEYMAIFEANRPMLENPDRIYPGQVLRIPPKA